MSHFTNIQTCFQNLFYLEKALAKLEIPNFKNAGLRLIHKLDLFYNNIFLIEQTDDGYLWSVEIHPLTKKRSTGKELTRYNAERQCYNVLKKSLPQWIQNYLRTEGYM